ncbi:MAG TPA: spherulation-specific family 4 protein [Candidatus Acidoferrum sp.]|jgi:hypothetical protein|nr:spherulation-specific family 4 protein [Candidatus Acidoferrum sp.]
MNFGKLLVAAWFAVMLTTAAVYPAPPGIMVPAYFAPSRAGTAGGYWDSLDYAAARVPLIAIMNPNSGPGTFRDGNYVRALASLHQAGGKVIGYVYSEYGGRALTNVEADIDAYLSFYTVDGFFIDEMADDENTNHLAYYGAIYRYIKAKARADGTRYSVTGNPGENTQEAYLAEPAADCLMVFENESTNYPGFVPADWEAKYPAQRFAHIAYHMNSAAMSNDVELAASRHAGWIYFSDDMYDRLPSYWTNEVQLCEQYRSGSGK